MQVGCLPFTGTTAYASHKLNGSYIAFSLTFPSMTPV